MEIEGLQKIEKESEKQIKQIQKLSKYIWQSRKMTLEGVHNKCFDAWDDLSHDIGSEIIPLVPVRDEKPATNLIFGSGSFSTGKFQIEQYQTFKKIIDAPPIVLQGIVANKSEEHRCNARKLSQEFKVPLIELDFEDWYHEFIDEREENPIRATSFWGKNLDKSETSKRFSIRQDQFHGQLGEKIQSVLGDNPELTDIVSLRGYNFPVSSNLFRKQKHPHVNDTHPADLTYIDSKSKAKLYAGWQSGAIRKMMDDNIHETYRGSLIEVDFMDKVEQIHELDEGALLSIGSGITPNNYVKEDESLNAKQIQNAMKIMDDYMFCTLEPAGLLSLFGVTKNPVNVVYNTLDNKQVIVKQRAIIVGNKFHSGVNAWGQNLKKDLAEIKDFLF